VTGDSRRREVGGRELGAGGDGSGNPEPQARRERLIDAFTKVASERGYEQTTVEQVAAAAGLDVPDFYAHFSDMRQCLSAAHDAFFERLVAEAASAVDPEQEWPWRVRDAVGAVLEFVEETASRARFFAIEVLVAGPLIMERHVSAIDQVVPKLREGRVRYPAAAGMPDLTESVLIAGAAALVYHLLLAEERLRPAEGLEAELVEILLTPYLGRKEARRIAG
jgi:AcrR family transcriptional regulator